MLEVIILVLVPIFLMGMGNFFTFFQPRWPFVPWRFMPVVLKTVFSLNVLGCASMGGVLGWVIGGCGILQGYLCLLLGALAGAGIAAGMAWAGFRLHCWRERQIEELQHILRNKHRQ